MTATVLVRALAALAVTTAALGAYNLVVWESPGPGSYRYGPDFTSILIHWLETYKIAAYDNETWQPADISLISLDIDPNQPPGEVIVHVMPDPNGIPYGHGIRHGARDLAEINLSDPNFTGTIANIILSRDLASGGPVVANNLTGNCLVGAVLDPNVGATGSILHAVELDCLTGTLHCYEMQGLTVQGGCPTAFTAQVIVDGAYTATMTLNGTNLDTLRVGCVVDEECCPMSGKITVGGSITDLYLNGGTRAPGLVEVAGNVQRTDILDGLGAGSTVRLGSVGPDTVWDHCEVRSWLPHDVHMDGLLDIIGYASDIHMFCMTRGNVHVGGDARILGFNLDIKEGATCHVEGSVLEKIIFGGVGDDPNDPNGFTPRANLAGTLTIDGNVTQPENAPFGLIMYHGSIEATGTLAIGGDLAAIVRLDDGSLLGQISVGHNLTAPGEIAVGGHGNYMAGAIDIYGDLDGGTIIVYGDLVHDPNINPAGGHVRIDGSFGRDYLSEIIFTGEMGPNAFVSCDFDGFDESDRWGEYGLVYIDGQDPLRPGKGFTKRRPVWGTWITITTWIFRTLTRSSPL